MGKIVERTVIGALFEGIFFRRYTETPVDRPFGKWSFSGLFFLVLLVFKSCLTVENKAIAAGGALVQPTQESTASLNSDDGDVPGSKLLTPASFGLDLEVAHVVPCDLKCVQITDGGSSMVAKVHVRIGNDFVVMLPDGRLVARRADEVSETDKPFRAAKPDEMAELLLAGPLERFRGMRVLRSKHYLFLYNTSDEFAKTTRNNLESMLLGVQKHVEKHWLTPGEPEVPMVVIMFATDREYQAYREMPEGVPGWYDMVSNQIVLREETDAGNLPEIARAELISTISHEGAHQILHNIGVQQRLSLWPMWLSEGLAEYFAPTSLANRGRWKGAGVVNDLRMFELESYLQSRYITGFDGKTISGTIGAPRLDSTGYATAWSIVHFLASKRKKEFNELVIQMSKLGPMRGMAARPGEVIAENLQYFHQAFGDDLKSMENEMLKYLAELEYVSPVSHLQHFVGMVVVPSENGEPRRLACFFHTRERVEKWKEDLGTVFSETQLQNAEWKVERVENRDQANLAIRRFLK
jgi:Protein of unknown function (DUF1570)